MKMENLFYTFLSLGVVALVAIGVYMFAESMGGVGHHEDETEAEELFMSTIKASFGYEDYTYVHRQTSEDGKLELIDTYIRNESEKYFKEDGPVYSSEIYYKENEIIVCMDYKEEKNCANISQNSTFYPIAYQISNKFFSNQKINQLVENNEILIEGGAIVFHGVEKEGAYNVLRYTLDYSKLSIEKLREIGISPKDPVILRAKEYNYTLWINPETNFTMKQKMNYVDLGIPRSSEGEVLLLSKEAMEMPEISELCEEEKVEGLFYDGNDVFNKLLNCMKQNQSELCIMSLAKDKNVIRICEYAEEKRDTCIVITALKMENAEYCELLGLENRDLCYQEFAYSFENMEYCDHIINQSIFEECKGLFNESMENETIEEESAENGIEEIEEEEEPSTEEEVECTSDSECIVSGCSNEICASEQLTTTCEYKEEYQCLRLTSCGCVEGACMWKPTIEYEECMKSFEEVEE
ncbi:eight-cysteine-cluster domain-containing protein [Candidatus Micrarchaeota archaeon]|nr:eight-cysteine-cluster domain-containing protein [Candidatus Micrarchaeota archaeon]